MNTPATEAFVPLVSTATTPDGAAEFRVTVLRNGDLAKQLHALAKPPVVAPAAGQRGGCEPRVTLQREGKRVSSIRIECACGAVMELDCVYDSVQ